VVDNRLKDVGSMEITEVHDKVSFAKVIDHKGKLTVGTWVIESAKAAAKTREAASASAS